MSNSSTTQRRGLTRRTFVRAAAAAGLTALSASRVYGANERVRVGLIGYGLIGQFHVAAFKHKMNADCALVAVADAYAPRVEQGASVIGGSVAKYADFRKMLDSKDVDVVSIATPDQWHAPMTIMACAAGKDVYVEKPTHLFVKEGRWMVDAARKYKRVVQVGTMQRSGADFAKGRELVQTGKIGPVVSVQISSMRNLMPGFGNPADTNPPPGMDWEMFLGPSAYYPYNVNRGIYQFRWQWNTAGGQMTNLGQHSLDVVHWVMDKQPTAVSSTGGRFFLKDNCDTPDTQDVIMEYPGFTVVVTIREATAGRGGQGMGGLVFYGTQGNMTMSRGSFTLTPDPKTSAQNAIANMLGRGHPVGGPLPVPGPSGNWTEAARQNVGGDEYAPHVRNLLDCVKSRKDPVSDIESGHRVATACHLANLSLLTGRKLFWDAQKEEIIGDPKANAMLERPYRAPWDKLVKAALG
jgi:predicted dehydrogenase